MFTVISGAQTGADIAGLWAAKLFGIPTGGWAPKNFLTLIGEHPEMAKTFGIKEHARSYAGRTVENLKMSDFTIVCASVMSAGSKLTIKDQDVNLVFDGQKSYCCLPCLLRFFFFFIRLANSCSS